MALRTRIRRKRRRNAPAVKRGSHCGQSTEKPGTGLLIGGAHDPAEKAADSLAARALGKSASAFSPPQPAPVVRRQCADCEAAEKSESVARQASTKSTIAPGLKAAKASLTATQAITSLGGGRPLNKRERSFFEPRFRANFGAVRLNQGQSATNAADSIQAEAFTKGSTITMGRTTDPVGTMAHELAHVVQGGAALRRKLRLLDPKATLPNSPPKNKETNTGGLIDMIKQFPGSPVVSIDAAGVVKLPDNFCDNKSPTKLNAGSKSPVSHGCLCQIINSKNVWTLNFFAKGDFPHTLPNGGTRGSAKTSKGGDLAIPSPYSEHEYGFHNDAGKIQQSPEWEVLAHEMCGHAALHDRNNHPEHGKAKMRHGHDEVVKITNQIRLEKDPKAKLRPETVAAPNCGESALRDRGKGVWKPSSSLKNYCMEKRILYIDDMKKAHPKEAKFQIDVTKVPLKDPLPKP